MGTLLVRNVPSCRRSDFCDAPRQALRQHIEAMSPPEPITKTATSAVYWVREVRGIAFRCLLL